MIACYDLARCPPTYDVVAFLALAELERFRLGEDSIQVVVLPGPVGGFRRDGLWPHTVEERIQLRDRVLVPLIRLLPSVSAVEVADTREAEGWGKGEYHVGLPAIVRALKSGCRPLRSPATPYGPDWAGDDRKIVTFTLREANHHPLRNSRTEEWLLAADELAARGRIVYILRDTCKARVPLLRGDNQVMRADDASLDLQKRAAVYGAASLNVGVSNGPMWMSIFMDAPTLMLRPTTNAAGACYDDHFFSRHGIRRGDQLPTSPPHQRLVWEEDTCANIVRAVEDMLNSVGER